MSIKLPADLERYVAEKMSSGQYASIDELIAQALLVLRNVERVLPSAEDDLRREIDLGLQDIEEGRVSEWDVEELKEHIRRRARNRKVS